jgi:hypothetical protein
MKIDKETDLQPIDLLIVCCQGTYHHGRYYSQFPNREVFTGHLLQTGSLIDQFRYTYIICSGGVTSDRPGGLSESRSTLDLWHQTGTRPAIPVSLEEAALDSMENLLLGLARARLDLGSAPMGRIAISSAWKFKKERFLMAAEALGVSDRFYFHGYAPASEALFPEEAQSGEIKQVTQMRNEDDPLLLGKSWEEKRKKRYKGSSYETRQDEYRSAFPGLFILLDSLVQKPHDKQTVKALQETVAKNLVLS